MDASAPSDLALVRLFYPTLDELGGFEHVLTEQVPPPYQVLLAHDDHMTVTVEAFHGSLVDLTVLEQRLDGDSYARKILLARQDNRAVVQFGIMRIDLTQVDPAVRREIEAQDTPLGRLLIRHNVHRHIQLTNLYRVTPGEELRHHLAMPTGRHTYGRTARILVAGAPAIELLEIVGIVDPDA